MLRDGILDALGDLIIDSEKAAELIDEFLSYVVVDIWHTDDILLCAADNDIIINEKEAKEIVNNIRHRHNAEEGITWDYIGAEIDYYAELRDNDKYALRVGEKEEV